MREVSAPKGAKLPPDEYGDNWLLLVTAGRLELAAADDDLVVAAFAASELLGAPPHPRVGRHRPPFPPPKPVGVGEGEVLASGRRGEEGLLAALWSMAAPAADDDALKLLLGRARAWDVRGGGRRRVRPRAPDARGAAVLRAVPALVAQPLGARARCSAARARAGSGQTPTRSFATKSTALAQAEPLLAEGGAAPGLTLLLGRVALTAGRSGGGGGAPRLRRSRQSRPPWVPLNVWGGGCRRAARRHRQGRLPRSLTRPLGGAGARPAGGTARARRPPRRRGWRRRRVGARVRTEGGSDARDGRGGRRVRGDA